VKIFFDLVSNASLLLALAILHSLVISRLHGKPYEQFLVGILYGAIATMGMLAPVILQKGLIFDGRSIVLSLAGLFGGPLAAAIAAFMAAATRIFIGGVGMYAGLGVIVTTAVMGVAFRVLRQKKIVRVNLLSLLFFGIVVHVVMIAWQLILPGGAGPVVVRQIALPVLLVFPAATVLFGQLLAWVERNAELMDELATTSSNLQRTLRAANVGLWEWDFACNVVRFSNEWKSQLGYEPDEILDEFEEWERLTHPEDLPRVMQLIEAYQKAPWPNYQVEFRMLHKDGKYRWILAQASLERDAQGQPIRMLGSHVDITTIKELELQLRRSHADLEQKVDRRTRQLSEANKQLQELDRLKSLFIASMSHELRTPLNSIIGFSSLLSDGLAGELNEEQKDFARRVRASGQHLLALISDVIDISRIEAGRISSSPQTFDAVELLSEALEQQRPDATRKDLVLEASLPEEAIVYTDRQRLLQCVLNLLSNAIKYTAKGSVRLEALQEKDDLLIHVQDTGVGIAEEDIPKLFKQFSRIDGPLTRTTLGTGLGLYLTQKIATEVLGGSVSVRSEPNKGSRFTLHIPARLEK